MGSRKPYIRDEQTGKAKYASDEEMTRLNRDFGKQLAYFKNNFDRLVGNDPKPPAPNLHDVRRSREAEAYFNLYYMGHRTHDR